MLAQRMPSILPELSRTEAIEVTRIHSISGDLEGRLATAAGRSGRHTIRSPPRASSAAPARAGSARSCSPTGECSSSTSSRSSPSPPWRRCASRWRTGASRSCGQSTRGYTRRGSCSIAATNPCPCGYAGDGRCRCSEADLARHARKLSGPLLDRIDLQVKLRNAGHEGLSAPPWTSSRAGARAREQGA